MTPNKILPIVGIGTSAGGLTALKTLFSYIPQDSGIAYVIVVHLSPEHKSIMAELLQPHIRMPVQQVVETTELKANNVYVIPPNANLNSIDTHLRLSKLEEKRIDRAPIDHFFRTLSKSHNGNSIGIVLTGTGSDGTLGLKEIKEKGGLTIVQDPEEAEYNGMPQSAITTGLIDMVLPLKKIPSSIFSYLSTKPVLISLEPGGKPDIVEQQIIQKIFAYIKSQTGRDFSRYKISTILRRLQRRMQIYHVELLSDYLEILQKKPEEAIALSDDFLITVTSFFRDMEVFKHIKEKVVVDILKNKKQNDPVRVWAVGCATGEEAYSLAIILSEMVSKMDIPPSIQIFASDLHEVSLKKARDGFYTGDIKSEVSDERLKKFFIKENNGYRIKKEIRENVVFAPHNLLSDPPFSRLDLIVCRNLLIYLKRDVQRDIFELFHYALLPKGYLVLGTSEHIDNSELFLTESKEYSIYTKKDVTGPDLKLPAFSRFQSGSFENSKVNKEQNSFTAGALHFKLIEQYAHPSLMLSQDYHILHVSESAGRYLKIPGGELSKDVFKLILPELQLELRSTVYAAKDKKKLVRSKPINVNINGEKKELFISSRIVNETDSNQVIIVMFEEYDEPEIISEKNISVHDIHDSYTDQLEIEIRDTRQHLQAIIEEYETSREEMKASNEEFQSANEELRSTMEELETSKEELQSVNEELSTMNQENRHKVEELAQLSSDLHNLLIATEIATLFLDREFRILRFTPRLGELFNVRSDDRGRLISDLTNKLGYDELIKDSKKVLKNLQPVEREIKDTDDNTYLTRVLPYRSGDDRIEGVVITFIDITVRKKMEEALRRKEEKQSFFIHMGDKLRKHIDANRIMAESCELLGEFLHAHRVFFCEINIDNNVSVTRPDYYKAGLEYIKDESFSQIFQEVQTVPGNSLSFIIADISKTKELSKKVRKTFTDLQIHAFMSVPLLKDDKLVCALNIGLNHPHEWTDDEIGFIREVAERTWDIAEKTRSEIALNKSKEYSENIIKTLHEPLIVLGPDLKVRSANEAFYSHFNVDPKETVGCLIYELGNGQWNIQGLKTLLEQVLPDNNLFNDFEVEHTFNNIGKRMMLLNARRLDSVQYILLGIRDITEQKKTEIAYKIAKEEAENAAHAKEEFLAHMSHEMRTPLNAVLGLVHLLLQQEPKKENLDNLNTMKIAAQNLRNLINNILDLSKIQSGKIGVEFTTFNLRHFISEIIVIHKPKAKEKGLQLETVIDDDVPEIIISDELKLSQVLHNLLGNALKFTNKGHIKLEIKVHKHKKENLWLDLSVTDTGIGIPDDKIDIIFDVFRQADSSTIRQYGGSGLGLAISKMYLDILCSKIQVDSVPGTGSKFYFTLPVKIGNEISTPEKEIPGNVKTILDNIKILVVEDDEFNRMVISQLLNSWSIEFDEANNGQAAFEIAEKNRYDLILMDVRMPVMDGYESARKIKEIDGYREVPILALTADISEKVKKEFKYGLFSGIYIKPFEPEKLFEKIVEIISKKHNMV